MLPVMAPTVIGAAAIGAGHRNAMAAIGIAHSAGNSTACVT
ncbi:MAG: hypothetical protein V9H25_00075 [Candidatus Competibacter sp.]